MPEMIYERVIEVKERVCLVQDSCQLNLQTPVAVGTTGEKVTFVFILVSLFPLRYIFGKLLIEKYFRGTFIRFLVPGLRV